MTVTLQIPPRLKRACSPKRRTHGLPLEDYLVDHVLRDAIEKSPPARKKSIVELFAPIRGLDLDFSSNPSTGRPVDPSG